MSDAGIVVAHQVVRSVGLVERIDEELELLKCHRPYHESDHVLNIAYNALCGGGCLDDIELRRNDEAYLDALGVDAIPDPTTAGDFCRRFDSAAIEKLTDVMNEARSQVWGMQPSSFFDMARIDVDGTLIPTTGECKEGMGLSYNGVWGYHGLLVSLANTGEPLYIVNRSGNRASHDGAVEYMDKAVTLCRQAGFRDILLRGDTAFSLTENFDRWHEDGVRFVLGYDAMKNLKTRADQVPDEEYARLTRRAEHSFQGRGRARQRRYKAEVIQRKGYKTIHLNSEDVAEFDYKPTKTKLTYRVIVLRKNLTIERGQGTLVDDIRYFFYITNDRSLTIEQVVRESNHRCNQERLIEQLKNGVRAFRAPLNTFNANWAYMVMTSLAWSIKAWMALKLPVLRRWFKKQARDRVRWLTMSFRSFVAGVIKMPAQVVSTGRQTIIRLLSWKAEQMTMFRLLEAI